jgi:hypothetical protein
VSVNENETVWAAVVPGDVGGPTAVPCPSCGFESENHGGSSYFVRKYQANYT